MEDLCRGPEYRPTSPLLSTRQLIFPFLSIRPIYPKMEYDKKRVIMQRHCVILTQKNNKTIKSKLKSSNKNKTFKQKIKSANQKSNSADKNPISQIKFVITQNEQIVTNISSPPADIKVANTLQTISSANVTYKALLATQTHTIIQPPKNTEYTLYSESKA